jgi:hypothetical protein
MIDRMLGTVEIANADGLSAKQEYAVGKISGTCGLSRAITTAKPAKLRRGLKTTKLVLGKRLPEGHQLPVGLQSTEACLRLHHAGGGPAKGHRFQPHALAASLAGQTPASCRDAAPSTPNARAQARLASSMPRLS